MPIQHKFLNHNWENGFYTENSILKTEHYKPEVLIIGTFNHGWAWNPADFFYGRGMYMWTNLANLFLHNNNHLINRRTINNDNPTLKQIFEICKKGKIVFADIVKGVKEEIQTIENQNQKNILVNNEYLWCSRLINNVKVGQYSDIHIDNLGNMNLLDDNVNEICKYLKNTPSIKYIYFTFKSGTWIVEKLKLIAKCSSSIISGSIFTPTGNGFGNNLIQPFNNKPFSILHCWIWNGIEHNVQIDRIAYCHLNHEWLIRNGVNPNNF